MTFCIHLHYHHKKHGQVGNNRGKNRGKSVGVVHNSFLDDLKIPTRWCLNSLKAEVKSDGSLTCTSYEVDIARYVKVYYPFIEVLLGSTSSQRVIICYIMNRLSVRHIEYMDLRYTALGLSKSTFHKALSELIDCDLLRKRDARAGTYWINPSMLFHGNRVSKYSSNTVPENDNKLIGLKGVKSDDDFDDDY